MSDFLFLGLGNPQLDRAPAIYNIAWQLTGDTAASEGGTDPEYTVQFSGYDLKSGETVSIDLAQTDSDTDGDDFSQTLAQDIDDALGTGQTRSGSTITFDSTAAKTLTFSRSIADDVATEGAEDFTLTISDASNGYIASGKASVTTTIAASD